MRKQIKKIVASVMVASLVLVGITVGNVAYAEEAEEAVTEYSLEEMLTYAIEDEYLAQAEYDGIMKVYGEVRPFSNIIKAEAKHISLLLPLFEEYSVALPIKDWASLVEIPDTIEATYVVGVTAEQKNIAMYEGFLKQELPDNVRVIFEELLNASKNHLRAFENSVNKIGSGTMGQNRKSNLDTTGNGNRTGNGTGTGTGNGSNSKRQGMKGSAECTADGTSCINR